MNKKKLIKLTKGKVSGFVEKARKRKKLKNDCVLDSASCCNNPLGCACEEANGYPLTRCEYWDE